MWVCHKTHPLSFCRVILNEVKNLKTSTNAFQILRNAQDDTMIVNFYYDTRPFLIYTLPTQPLRLRWKYESL